MLMNSCKHQSLWNFYFVPLTEVIGMFKIVKKRKDMKKGVVLK